MDPFTVNLAQARSDAHERYPIGVGGGIVEVAETFIGRINGAPVKCAFHGMTKVLALVDLDKGKARTMVLNDVIAKTLMPSVQANMARAEIMTDERYAFAKIFWSFHWPCIHRHSAGQYVNIKTKAPTATRRKAISALSSAA